MPGSIALAIPGAAPVQRPSAPGTGPAVGEADDAAATGGGAAAAIGSGPVPVQAERASARAVPMPVPCLMTYPPFSAARPFRASSTSLRPSARNA
jgi:hypothetical protein